MEWIASWSVQTIPPCKQKHRDLEYWVVKFITTQISIQVSDELQAGLEYMVCIHADLVHVLLQWPNNDQDLEWLANCSCHTDVGEI